MTSTKDPAAVTAGGTRASGLPSGLRVDALGFPTLLAQGVALISPTMTAVLIIPLTFSYAGNGTWLAYAFATVMLLFVAAQLNVFARRSASAGSMYAYIGRGLGPKGGVMSGWTLLWCYAFIAIAGFTGFSIFVNQFLLAVGIHVAVPAVVCFLISAAVCCFVAFKDIHISSVLMLVLEGLSMAVIIGLCVVVLARNGNPIDTAQFTLKGLGLSDLNFAIVVCIFSLVGFESATALGGEAKNALKTVPRAVTWSLVITGLFFVVVSYVEVLGTHGYKTPLSALEAPLNTIAEINDVGFLKIPIALGAMFSFFSLSLSCINAGARILFPMAAHGVFPRTIASVHDRNRTPHVAIVLYTVVIVAVASILQIWIDPVTTFGYAGTLAAYGFLLAYFLISIASLTYLRRLGQLRRRNVVTFVLAILCLTVPTIGSFYPVPAAPVQYFPYLFAAYLLAGAAWLITLSRRRPGVLTEIELDLENTIDAHDEPVATPA